MRSILHPKNGRLSDHGLPAKLSPEEIAMLTDWSSLPADPLSARPIQPRRQRTARAKSVFVASASIILGMIWPMNMSTVPFRANLQNPSGEIFSPSWLAFQEVTPLLLTAPIVEAEIRPTVQQAPFQSPLLQSTNTSPSIRLGDSMPIATGGTDTAVSPSIAATSSQATIPSKAPTQNNALIATNQTVTSSPLGLLGSFLSGLSNAPSKTSSAPSQTQAKAALSAIGQSISNAYNGASAGRANDGQSGGTSGGHRRG